MVVLMGAMTKEEEERGEGSDEVRRNVSVELFRSLGNVGAGGV